MILDGIVTLIQQDSGCQAVMSTRVTPMMLPRGYQLPAACVHRYGGSQEYGYAGPANLQEDQVQVDVYGDTPEDAQQAALAVRKLLEGYSGTLPDGTVVQGCFFERGMDMPFLAHADTKGLANRVLLGFRVVSEK